MCRERAAVLILRGTYIIDLCQLYQVRTSPMIYGCYRDMKILPLGTKGSITAEAISPLPPAAR